MLLSVSFNLFVILLVISIVFLFFVRYFFFIRWFFKLVILFFILGRMFVIRILEVVFLVVVRVKDFRWGSIVFMFFIVLICFSEFVRRKALLIDCFF